MPIYLDHNATTPVDPRVLARFMEIEQSGVANPASPHASGRRARAILEAAREAIAASLRVVPEDVVFVSGGTEANNLVALGLGDPDLPVLASAAEHPSLLEAVGARGAVELGIDATGLVLLTPPPVAVGMLAVVHGQSEVGTIQLVDRARACADALAIPLHIDASQTLGRLDLTPAVTAADTMTLSPHKAGGPRGVGVLLARTRELRPLLRGGSQERNLRAGTVSPALAAAAALTIDLATREWEQRAVAMRAARAAFELGLEGLHLRRITPVDALPNTVMLDFEDVSDGRILLPALDLAGVEASHGSACSSGSPLPPRILQAMGLDPAAARRCVRFSFSHHTTIVAAQQASAIVEKVVRRLASVR